MRTKKLFITLGLGLVLLASAGAPALAQNIHEGADPGVTQISGSLSSRYTVEIPDEIVLGNMDRSVAPTDAKFSVTARNVQLQAGLHLNVNVQGEGKGGDGETAFILKNADSFFLPYEVWTADDQHKEGKQVSPAAVFAEFQNAIDDTGLTKNGLIRVRPKGETIAGTYRGNLIFTCDIVSD